MKRVLAGIALLLLMGSTVARAEDWPEFRGKGRTGEWNETGILEKFPAEGLKVLWRTPIKEGYSSPTVSDGRVFITDFTRIKGNRGPERALAIDEKTGRILWTVEWEADYGAFVWPNGPRATPTVDGDRVYILGAQGLLQCLDVKTGAVIWKKDYLVDYKADTTANGVASAPIVDGPRLIAIVGGQPDALIVAWDKLTGKELWRSLPATRDPGVALPIIVNAGGTRQLIIWSPNVVHSLDPVTGKLYWDLPYKAPSPMNIAVPVFTGKRLFLSNFYTGSILIALDDKKPAATMVWKGNSESEIATEGLHAVIGTPIILGDYIYGTCSYGQLRCLKLSTGERVWETQVVTKERARWASAHIVKNGDRVFVSNDRGDLMIARLTAEGYQEIDRTPLLKPTSPPGIRRQLNAVTVVHPAYANRNIYMRNDEEIIAASMAATDAPVSTSSNRSPTAPAAPAAPAAVVASVPRPAAAEKAVEIQYIPSLSGEKKKAERDAEYSSLYLLLGGGGHSLAFTSDNGVVLVNSKNPGWGQAVLNKLPLITEAPVSTIINTNPDVEYTGNNGAFPGKVTIVAHANTKAAMTKMEAFKGANAKFLPNKTFTDKLTLFGGKNRVDLYYFGAAHTNGDAVVAIPASNLAYMGELLPAREAPAIDTAHGGSAVAFPDTLARALETLKANDIQYIVSGRGASRRGGLQIDVMSLKDVQEYIDFNRDFLAAVNEAMNAGKSVDEAAATLKLPDKYKAYGMEHAKANIQAIYAELRK